MSEKEIKPNILECVEYFRKFPVYDKVLSGFLRKYESLGRIGGVVTLSSPTLEEKKALQGFLPKVNPYEAEDIKISTRDFKKSLSQSRFEDISLEELLTAYFHKPLESKRERAETLEQSWNTFFDQLVERCQTEDCRLWLRDIKKIKKNAYQFLKKQFYNSKIKLDQLVMIQDQAIDKLPVKVGKREFLPVFATVLTGNPHYFDVGTDGEKLLSYYLCDQPGDISEKIFFTETRWERYYRVGIVRDDVSNHVLTYGLEGTTKSGGIHKGLQGYCEEQQPVHISLLTLMELTSVCGKHKPIYLVENPAIFSAIIRRFPDEVSAVCTNGQLRLASLLLLDLLAEGDAKFLYAGDFDPEGLQIADKLKRKYADCLSFWLYEESYYAQAKSTVVLPERRLKKLEGIESEELCAIVECVHAEKFAGYQENMLDEYLQWIDKERG